MEQLHGGLMLGYLELEANQKKFAATFDLQICEFVCPEIIHFIIQLNLCIHANRRLLPQIRYILIL